MARGHPSDELGQGALEAAWEFGLDVEVSQAGGEQSLACFLDCSKCYERISFAGLQRRVTETGFPQRLASMVMSIYSGAWRVRVGGFVVELLHALDFWVVKITK